MLTAPVGMLAPRQAIGLDLSIDSLLLATKVPIPEIADMMWLRSASKQGF